MHEMLLRLHDEGVYRFADQRHGDLRTLEQRHDLCGVCFQIKCLQGQPGQYLASLDL